MKSTPTSPPTLLRKPVNLELGCDFLQAKGIQNYAVWCRAEEEITCLQHFSHRVSGGGSIPIMTCLLTQLQRKELPSQFMLLEMIKKTQPNKQGINSLHLMPLLTYSLIFICKIKPSRATASVRKHSGCRKDLQLLTTALGHPLFCHFHLPANNVLRKTWNWALDKQPNWDEGQRQKTAQYLEKTTWLRSSGSFSPFPYMLIHQTYLSSLYLMHICSFNLIFPSFSLFLRRGILVGGPQQDEVVPPFTCQ